MKAVEVQIYIVRIGGRHPVLTRVLTDTGPDGIGDLWAASRA